jgi:hypothetical protein
MAGGLGDLGDRLHAGGAGADHADALALERYRRVGPQARVVCLAGEITDSGDIGHHRR